MSSHKLEMFTDYVCPWCYLGDSRVKKLTSIFEIDIEIIHFPLHPDTPKEGKSLLDLFVTNQEDIDNKNQNMKNSILIMFTITLLLSSCDTTAPDKTIGFVTGDNAELQRHLGTQEAYCRASGSSSRYR